MGGESCGMVETQTNGDDDQRACFPGKMDAPLFSWPWDKLGAYKYLLYGPFLAKVAYSSRSTWAESWCMHVLTICALRGLIHQLWSTYHYMFFLNRNRRVSQSGIDFNQIDREWDWDNFIILQAFVASMAYLSFPAQANLPMWNTRGLLCCLILHVALSEPIYYLIHRFLHAPYLYRKYHWLHHTSKITHPYTAGHATFMEHLVQCVIIGVPILATALIGCGSIIMIYTYVLIFDFLRCLGHSNVEVIPYRLFQCVPFLRYLISTPSYHSLHHMNKGTNFCLFMPLFDILGNTMDKNSWDLHKKISTGLMEGREPDLVFLAHAVDLMQAMHVPFLFRSFSSMPYTFRPFLLPLWPFSFLVMLGMWVKSSTFLFSFYHLRGRLQESWAVPRFGFQYFLPFATEGINKHIERAILRADKMGVKVMSLAALNKNEGLNGGGKLFVDKHPNLRVRLVHGNTLTAAVILKGIPADAKEVFLSGATSKLGRAIALYLASRSVTVLMLTQSTQRFMRIREEAPVDCQKFLVQVTKYQAAKHCKTWILGKWATPLDQTWAPPGTHFHQFVIPPVLPLRRDCTYGEPAAMKLPEDVEGLGSCEYQLRRGVIHACHAGGLVHLLEGWSHHEVGAIDVDQIDFVWKAALRHGLKPA